MNKPKQIWLHCSATQEGKDFTVQDIDKWHRQRGFAEIGYHYVIYRDGTVHNGRDVSKVPAAQAPKNTNTVAVCYIGGVDSKNKPKDTRTADQRFALFKLVMELQEKYGISDENVKGHYELPAAKACPSFDMNTFRKELKMFKEKRKNMQGF